MAIIPPSWLTLTEGMTSAAFSHLLPAADTSLDVASYGWKNFNSRWSLGDRLRIQLARPFHSPTFHITNTHTLYRINMEVKTLFRPESRHAGVESVDPNDFRQNIFVPGSTTPHLPVSTQRPVAPHPKQLCDHDTNLTRHTGVRACRTTGDPEDWSQCSEMAWAANPRRATNPCRLVATPHPPDEQPPVDASTHHPLRPGRVAWPSSWAVLSR